MEGVILLLVIAAGFAAGNAERLSPTNRAWARRRREVAAGELARRVR